MGICISVSVDSWVQQTIEDLTVKEYPESDPIYRRLVSSASVTSEIYVVEPEFFESLMQSHSKNIKNILSVCLENMISNDTRSRLNASAILTRMLPYLCTKDYFISIENFALDSINLFDVVVSPGAHIISSCMDFLASVPTNDGNELLCELDGNIVMFDLLVLIVCLLIKFSNNLTLYHQLIISASEKPSQVVLALLNYVHVGGRSSSLISLLIFLMFHPTHDFLSLAESFLKSGGKLSAELCTAKNDDSDIFCYLCSLAFNDDVTPMLNIENPNLIRIALLKVLMNKNITVDPYQIQSAYNLTTSKIARAILGRMTNVPPEITSVIPVMNDIVFENPFESSTFNKWVLKTVPEMFLNQKNFWFDKTGLSIERPNFLELEQYVSQSV